MPQGGARRGAGRPRKPSQDHLPGLTHTGLTVTARYRPTSSRCRRRRRSHGRPARSDRSAIGSAGRSFVDEMLDRYDWDFREGQIALEAGKAKSALAATRTIDPRSKRRDRRARPPGAGVVETVHVPAGAAAGDGMRQKRAATRRHCPSASSGPVCSGGVPTGAWC